MDIVKLFHQETGQAMEFADGGGAHHFLRSVADAGKWVVAEGRQVLEAFLGASGDAPGGDAVPATEAQAVAGEAAPPAAAAGISATATGA